MSLRRLLGVAVVAVGVVVVVVVGFSRTARADELADARKAYAEQKYDVAIAKYEALVAAGVRHEELYYNLGNAYFRAGRLGRAVLNYERALLLEPRFEDAQYNLDVARETVAVRFGKDSVSGALRDPFWIRAVHWLPPSTLIWSFLVLDVLFFAVLIAIRFLPTGFLRTGLIVGNVFAGAAGLVLGVLLFGRIWYLERVRMSVVVADEVVMRECPDQTCKEMPKLHAGLRVVLVRETTGWNRIRLANKMEGWVPAGSVEEI
jgi:HAMP domain-containing protein